MASFNKSSQLYGRNVITTNKRLTGDAQQDVDIIAEILPNAIQEHEKNVREMNTLFDMYFNSKNYWEKTKEQRKDINNKISIPTCYALSRTINSYLFGLPTKIVARTKNSQEQIEELSAMLDYAGNHRSTTNATLCASICGLGYKLVLPANNEEIEETGIPFVINKDIIYPQEAFVVYTNDIIPKEILGVVIGTYYNENGEAVGNQYTCWSKYAQYVFKPSENCEGYDLVKQKISETEEVDFYLLTTNAIPLVEVARNPFRKGDWEVCTDLIKLKNNLLSSRIDDIQQFIDYVMVLVNCQFETEEDRNKAITDRIFELKTISPQFQPSLNILKNALDQNAVQVYADYIDLLIQECVGIPNRQERSGGGNDTGKAVQYRNGYRDLENNAGLIIPQMDNAEMKVITLCINLSKNMAGSPIKDLKPYDVRCKFVRSENDDIISSSQAFATYFANGCTMEDALLLSRSGTDPSEIAGNAYEAYQQKRLLWQMKETTEVVETENVNNEPQQDIIATENVA